LALFSPATLLSGQQKEFRSPPAPLIAHDPLCSAKNLILLNFRPAFMPLSSQVGIRDADHPERSFLPVGDRTKYGDLNFVAPECLLRVQEYLGPGWSVGGLGCNE